MKTIYKKLLFLFLLLPFSVLAQSTLSGVVLDKSSGQPLPGVNVVVSGTSNGVVTDLDGKFKLTKVVKGDKIVFSFIGLKSESIVYSNQTSITVSLQEDANQLSEVVVQVGYGTVKKKDATGSLTTITTKDFNKGANVTAENLLNGRVAGLSINTSGAPGSGSQIRIRGGASLSASNDPLIVIDGLPIDNSTSVGATSILSSLNPATIESMTVLKDASATAIYGSRASNGVIIITTKKGGKNLEAEYNFQLGIGRKVNQVSVFGADEYRNIVGVRQNQLLAADPNTGVNLPNLLGTANTNWQDEIYRTAEMVDQSLTVKGSLFKQLVAHLGDEGIIDQKESKRIIEETDFVTSEAKGLKSGKVKPTPAPVAPPVQTSPRSEAPKSPSANIFAANTPGTPVTTGVAPTEQPANNMTASMPNTGGITNIPQEQLNKYSTLFGPLV